MAGIKQYLKEKKESFKKFKEKKAEERKIKRLVKEEDRTERLEEQAEESKVIEAKLERQKTAQTQVKKVETIKTKLRPQGAGMSAGFGRHLQAAVKVGGQMREFASKMDIAKPPKNGSSMFGSSMFGTAPSHGVGGSAFGDMFTAPKKSKKGKNKQKSKKTNTIFDI